MKFISSLSFRWLLVLACLGCGPTSLMAAPAKPNLILIMSDDQGYGDLACHGNPDVKTPNLDRLEGESVSFSNFHVDAYCPHTILVFMTDNGSAQNPFPAGMRGQKGSQYDGGHRVPCFVHWSGGGIEPRHVDRLTAHFDLLPTFIRKKTTDIPK